MENEMWKDIIGYEGFYQVSNLGRIKSLYRIIKRSSGRVLSVKEKVMVPILNKEEYLRIKLCKNKKQETISIHRIVATCFISNSEKKSQVNHINGNKEDNSVGNLEWVTSKENVQHALINGLMIIRGTNKKIPCFQLSLSGTILNKFESRSKASKVTGANRRDISDCINNKLKTSGGFLWK